MADNTKQKANQARKRLGDLTSFFGGMLGGASDALQGKKTTKKGVKKKSARQKMLDEI